MRVQNKYFAKRTEFNGKKYHSKLEAKYAKFLEEEKEKGRLAFYLEQVPLRLPGNTTLRLDFMEFWKTEDDDSLRIEFVDVKGMKPTKDFLIKKRQVEELYPIKLTIIEKI